MCGCAETGHRRPFIFSVCQPIISDLFSLPSEELLIECVQKTQKSQTNQTEIQKDMILKSFIGIESAVLRT